VHYYKITVSSKFSNADRVLVRKCAATRPLGRYRGIKKDILEPMLGK
jgi:hypothetical protein